MPEHALSINVAIASILRPVGVCVVEPVEDVAADRVLRLQVGPEGCDARLAGEVGQVGVGVVVADVV